MQAPQSPQNEQSGPRFQRAPAECAVFADYGKNYLTPIDILVKTGNGDSDNACIKARFALSIKVEEPQFVTSRAFDGNQTPLAAVGANQTGHPILGYVPLEHVISVEESCPEVNLAKGQTTKGTTASLQTNGDEKTTLVANDDEDKSVEDEELEMIVTFDCGKFSFTFRKDESKVYVSAIRGMVKLG